MSGLQRFLLCVLLAWIGSSCADRTSSPGVRRVVLIGVDGLEWRVLDRLVGQGRLPNLARFIEGGVRGELATLAPAYSPVIWSSIATGKLPHKHGITGFVKDGPSGHDTLFTSNQRRGAALWTALGDLGRRVAVVGWWTTWPAEPVNGVAISDRMMYNRFNVWFGLEHSGADLPAQTFPDDLFERLADVLRPPDGLEDEFFDRFLPEAPRPELTGNLHDPWYELFMVYARDRAYDEMLDRVTREETFDFLAYYVNGPDIASHYFWKYLFPEDWDNAVASEDLQRYGDVIPRYYEYVDEAIAPLLAQVGDTCLVVLVSDHGFVAGERPDSPAISGTHYRAAPPGVLVMAGGSLPQGKRIERASVLDLAPSLLHVLGQAVARDMDGRVLPIIADAAAGREIQFVDSYDRSSASSDVDAVTTVYDDAILEKLRALGYIGSDTAPSR